MNEGAIMSDFDSAVLSKLMQFSHERQRIISNNMANASTPGYIRRDIDFEKHLARAIESDNINDLENVKGQVFLDFTDEPRVDGNNVQATREMNEMMQNGLLYNLLAKSFSTRVEILRTAMR